MSFYTNKKKSIFDFLNCVSFEIPANGVNGGVVLHHRSLSINKFYVADIGNVKLELYLLVHICKVLSKY